VQIDGLLDFPELNGQAGVIVAFDRRAGRYHVELPDGQIRAVRPPHLIARQSPAKESEFGRWVAPAPDPSHVDEPDPPDEVPCASDEEVRRVFEELDDEFRVRRDVKEAKLRRGQQLLREGHLRGRSLQELRRGGVLPTPIRIRFTRHRPAVIRFGMVGAYMEAVLKLDQALNELIREEARRNLGPGRFSFYGIAAPGWTGPPSHAGPAAISARERQKKGGWAGWVCRDCGHINECALLVVHILAPQPECTCVI